MWSADVTLSICTFHRNILADTYIKSICWNNVVVITSLFVLSVQMISKTELINDMLTVVRTPELGATRAHRGAPGALEGQLNEPPGTPSSKIMPQI